MVCRSPPSCNFILMENSINTFPFSIYSLIATRLVPVIWDYNLHRSIMGLYYLIHKYIDLNLITTDQPRFELRSPEPKAAMLTFFCAPLTIVVFDCCKQSLKRFLHPPIHPSRTRLFTLLRTI